MTTERKNIWIGLVAILFAVAAWLLLVLITGLMAYTEIYTPGGIDALTDDSPVSIGAGVLLILAIPINIIALVLAIAGLFIRTENRIFPLISLIMSCALFILIAVLIGVGIAESY